MAKRFVGNHSIGFRGALGEDRRQLSDFFDIFPTRVGKLRRTCRDGALRHWPAGDGPRPQVGLKQRHIRNQGRKTECSDRMNRRWNGRNRRLSSPP